jgi:hypothetical protein
MRAAANDEAADRRHREFYRTDGKTGKRWSPLRV